MKGSEIRKGHVIDYNNKLLRVVNTRHTKPGKGPAYIQAECQDIKTKSKENIRIRTSESLERVSLSQQKVHFSYQQGEQYCFMDIEDYTIYEIDRNVLNFDPRILKEGIDYEMESYEEIPIGISAPQNIQMNVIASEQYIKGQTATKTYKNITLENDINLSAPVHIKQGDVVLIDSETLEYIKKV